MNDSRQKTGEAVIAAVAEAATDNPDEGAALAAEALENQQFLPPARTISLGISRFAHHHNGVLMRRTLIIGSVIGTFLFGTVFALTFLSVSAIERSAREFVTERVKEELRAYDRSKELEEIGKDLLKALKKGVGKGDKEKFKARIKAQLEKILPEICDAECMAAAGAHLDSVLGEAFREELERSPELKESLLSKGKERYYRMVAKLVREIRIFSGINLALFGFLLIALLKNREPSPAFIVPAALLFASTVFSAVVYCISQNWLYALIRSDYVGPVYLVYVSLVFLFLIDIVLNRSRVTSRALDFLEGLIPTGS